MAKSVKEALVSSSDAKKKEEEYLEYVAVKSSYERAIKEAQKKGDPAMVAELTADLNEAESYADPAFLARYEREKDQKSKDNRNAKAGKAVIEARREEDEKFLASQGVKLPKKTSPQRGGKLLARNRGGR